MLVKSEHASVVIVVVHVVVVVVCCGSVIVVEMSIMEADAPFDFALASVY